MRFPFLRGTTTAKNIPILFRLASRLRLNNALFAASSGPMRKPIDWFCRWNAKKVRSDSSLSAILAQAGVLKMVEKWG
jgi:hypothetical protein